MFCAAFRPAPARGGVRTGNGVHGLAAFRGRRAALVQRLLAGWRVRWFCLWGLLAARLGAQQPGAAACCWACTTAARAGASLSAVLCRRCGAAPARTPGLGMVGWPWPACWPRWCCCGRRALQPGGAGCRCSLAQPVASSMRWAPFAPALLGYGLFGVGYIGYMTFGWLCARAGRQRYSRDLVLRADGPGGGAVLAHRAGCWTAAAAGRRCAAQRLLGVATVLPALTSAWRWCGLGLLFGAVFLSVVASTTALVRHNLPQALWASGITPSPSSRGGPDRRTHRGGLDRDGPGGWRAGGVLGLRAVGGARWLAAEAVAA